MPAELLTAAAGSTDTGGAGPSRPMAIPEGGVLKDNVAGSAPSATSNPSSFGDTLGANRRTSLGSFRSVARFAGPLNDRPGSTRPFADLDMDPNITQVDGA